MKKVFTTVLAVIAAASMMAGITPHFSVEAGYDHGSARCFEEGVDKADLKEAAKMFKMDGFHVGGNVQLDFMDGQHIPSLVIGLNYQFLNNDLTKSDKYYKDEKKAFMDEMKSAEDVTNPIFRANITMHTIQVPIRGQYTYQINDTWKVFGYTGPQLRFHVALTEGQEASCKYEGKKTGKASVYDWVNGTSKATVWVDGEKEVKKGEKEDRENCMQWFDMSWGFGVGFGWKDLSFAFNYDLGMMNLMSKSEKDHYKDMNKKAYMNSDALALTIAYRIK